MPLREEQAVLRVLRASAGPTCESCLASLADLPAGGLKAALELLVSDDEIAAGPGTCAHCALSAGTTYRIQRSPEDPAG